MTSVVITIIVFMDMNIRLVYNRFRPVLVLARGRLLLLPELLAGDGDGAGVVRCRDIIRIAAFGFALLLPLAVANEVLNAFLAAQARAMGGLVGLAMALIGELLF